MSRRTQNSAVAHTRACGGRLRAACALAAVLASLALCAFSAAAAGAAEPGVNLGSFAPSQIAETRALGSHWVRLFVSWRAMQPAPGTLDPGTLASYESALAQLPAGTRVILDVVGSPQWETGSADEHAPPANPNDYAAFVGALAQRLGPRVAAYEIWNEEDAAAWWSGGPNPQAYTELLKAAYPAIKAAEPRAAVVLGGLTGNDYQFLEGVYAAGGKGYFDAVGVHTDTACDVLSPYEFLRSPENRLVPDSFLAYREVHAVMLANGDNKPIWMTELSWRTTEATCNEGAWAGQKPEGVSEAQQATYLAQAYHCLAQAPYVQVALWFPLQDSGSVLSGLLRANGTRKPSFGAFSSYVRGGDQLSEPCGTFSGPTITVASPADHVTYTGPLPISVSARSPQGVFRIRLEIDGRLIRNYDGSSYPDTLSGQLDWMGARRISPGWHTLTILAYDKQRNVSEISLSIFHGSARGAHSRRRSSRRARRRRTRTHARRR